MRVKRSALQAKVAVQKSFGQNAGFTANNGSYYAIINILLSVKFPMLDPGLEMADIN